eukprot:6195142-Pleurochrysis_carterae.AAC.2
MRDPEFWWMEAAAATARRVLSAARVPHVCFPASARRALLASSITVAIGTEQTHHRTLAPPPELPSSHRSPPTSRRLPTTLPLSFLYWHGLL